MRLILLALLLIPCALGATISGTVYDLSLQETQDAIVTITTTPEQRIVAKDGTYQFSVPEGNYELEAWALLDGEEWRALENITVLGDGEYTLDLILGPSFEGLDDLDLEDPDIPSLLPDTEAGFPLAPTIIVLALGICALLWFFLKRRPKRIAEKVIHEDEFRDAVLAALKKHGGRATQKELRRELPFSEAKASLVITELESEGKVRKIKKGRGNVIVLN